MDQLIEVMRGDKKVRGGQMRFALLKEIGVMNQKDGWTVAVDEPQLRNALG